MTQMKMFALVSAVALIAITPARAQQSPTPPDDMQEFMKAMTTVLSGGTNAAAVVDFRALRALLPAELPGMKRTNAKGEKTGAMGMTISTAEGSYEADGASVQVKITDNGALGVMGALQAAWASQEIDSESDTGFERTTMYGNYKAKEEYDSASRSGRVEILVATRFMVEVSGNDVEFSAIQAAARAVDLAKLATLQPKPPQPAGQ